MKTLRTFGQWLRSPSHLLILAGSLLPLALVLLYVYSYRVEVPFRDEWQLDARPALAAAEGHLTLQDLVYVNDGHRTFFTNVISAISAVTSRWNLRQEALWIPLVAFLCLVLLLLILYRTESGATALLALPFSLLTFSLYRSYNWWSIKHSQWYFVNFFFLASIWFISRKNLTWKSLIFAVVLGWCTTFSLATGMLVWPIAFVLFWLNGERHLRTYVVWVVSGTIAIALYLINSGIVPALGSTDSYVSTGSMLQPSLANQNSVLEFIPRFLGAGLLADYRLATIAATMTWVGVVLFVVQIICFWRLHLGMRRLAPWLGVAAFGFGSALITALGRSDSLGINRAFTIQYSAASHLFWIALVALMLISARHSLTAIKIRWPMVLVNGVSVIALFCLFFLYGYSSIKVLQDDAIHWEHGVTLVSQPNLLPDEQCAINYLYTRKTACFTRVMGSVPRQTPALDRIAADNLAIFAQVPAVSLLPNGYQPGSPLVIASPDIWINVHVRDRLFDTVTEASVYHLVSADAHQDEVAQIPNPPQKVSVGTAPQPSDAFKQQMTQVDQVWLAQMAASPDLASAYEHLLVDQGFVSIYSQRFEQPAPLTLVGYQRFAQPPQPMFRLGQNFVLQGWTLAHDVNAKACDSLPLETLWSSDTTPPLNYSMTAVIAGSDGLGVARADGAPSGLETTYWRPDQLYEDRRTVTVPCNLAAGDYSLLVGLYDFGNGQNLPATSMDGASVGNLIYLTTLHIQS